MEALYCEFHLFVVSRIAMHTNFGKAVLDAAGLSNCEQCSSETGEEETGEHTLNSWEC